MTLEQYGPVLKTRLKKTRYLHSLAVAEEAARLAELYGADKEKSYLAGLLHDICKNDSKALLLQMFDRFGILLSDVERSSPKLWHAIAGEAFLREELALSDEEILAAVRYHTTARKNMSLLEKVLYLADFTSADRQYNGVEKMRELVEISMEKAMAFALVFTIGDLAASELPIHPDTLDAYNQIMMGK